MTDCTKFMALIIDAISSKTENRLMAHGAGYKNAIQTLQFCYKSMQNADFRVGCGTDDVLDQSSLVEEGLDLKLRCKNAMRKQAKQVCNRKARDTPSAHLRIALLRLGHSCGCGCWFLAWSKFRRGFSCWGLRGL